MIGGQTGPALLIIPSHGTHRRNIVRVLRGFPEFEGYKAVFVSRIFAPATVVKLRNWVRRRLGPQSDTVVVSRASENLVIDGFTERIIRWNASQVTKFTRDIGVVVFGEPAGEVFMLAGQLSLLTGARTCFVPEGLGVLFQTRARFEAQGLAWQEALRAQHRQLQNGSSARPRRDTLRYVGRSIGKFWWRLRRFVFLVSARPGAPKLSGPRHLDYFATDWLEKLPDGFTAERTWTQPVGIPEQNLTRRALFLHGPYEFEEQTWLACLRALDLGQINTLVLKQHRNPLGFDALEVAARALSPSLEVEVLRDGNIEEYFFQARYSLVAGIDSSALLSASRLLPECRIVSTLDTLERSSSARDQTIVARYREEFDHFRSLCPSRMAFV